METKLYKRALYIFSDNFSDFILEYTYRNWSSKLFSWVALFSATWPSGFGTILEP